jgi:hypothetical protein
MLPVDRFGVVFAYGARFLDAKYSDVKMGIPI